LRHNCHLVSSPDFSTAAVQSQSLYKFVYFFLSFIFVALSLSMLATLGLVHKKFTSTDTVPSFVPSY